MATGLQNNINRGVVNNSINNTGTNLNLGGDVNNKIEILLIKNYLWWSATTVILIGLIMIGLIGGYAKVTWAIAFGSGVLIAGGALLGGAFLGFIFGIPSILQDPTARLRYNDNLVQISDWLTKIIVGVGLTQLYNVPSFVRRVGEHFQKNFGDDVWGRNVAIAIMVYYFILGFIIIYFWAKTDYSTVMKALDDDLNTVLQNLATVVKEKEITEQQLQTVSDEKVQTEQQLEDVIKESETKSAEASATIKTFADQVKFSSQNNDPQKGQWGGKTEDNGRKVAAFVRESSFDNEWFTVTIEVTSTDQNKPLSDEVIFHLHPSFPNQDRTIVVEDGIAIIKLIAYGAFTVGVECDKGETKLEIDLAELPDVPQIFKER